MATTLHPVDRGCTAGLFCERYVNQPRPAWLYEVPYLETMSASLRASAVELSERPIRRSAPGRVTVAVRANRKLGVDQDRSGLWLHPKDGAPPVPHAAVKRGACSGGSCRYKATFGKTAIAAAPRGAYRWSFALTLKKTGQRLLAQGAIDLE